MIFPRDESSFARFSHLRSGKENGPNCVFFSGEALVILYTCYASITELLAAKGILTHLERELPVILGRETPS